MSGRKTSSGATRSSPRRAARAGRPKPDNGTASLLGVALMTLFWVAVLLGVVFFVLPIMLQDYRDAHALKSRGLASTAQVVSTWSKPGSARSAPTYHFRFAFRTGPGARPTVDEAYITDREFARIAPNDRVPVIYDPLNPSLGALNFGDKVHRRRPLLESVGWTALLAGILAAGLAGHLALTLDALRQWRAQRGRPQAR